MTGESKQKSSVQGGAQGETEPMNPQQAAPQESVATGSGNGPSSADLRAGRASGSKKSDESERARAEDHALIRRAQAGEEDAFAELVQRHEQRAFRVARNLVPCREDAQDLAQEAFLRVFRNIERFDFKHDFTTWLYRIVTNLGIDHLRKRRPAVSTSSAVDEDADFDLPDDAAPAPSEPLEAAETAVLVRECIDSLAPHFQVVLALRELEGMSCIDIAKIVGATHVTVRWRLHRGRKLFQEEWDRRLRMEELRAGGGKLGFEGDSQISNESSQAPTAGGASS